MNHVIENLNKLRTVFKPYSYFWHDWEYYKFNGLTQEDIYFLNIFRIKNFTMNIEDSLMFYFRKEIIEGIIQKLENTLLIFKNWVVKEWQKSLCIKALDGNFLEFYTSKLDKLLLERELINILNEFNRNTLSEIVKISDEALSAEPYFEIIYRFSLTQRQIEKKNEEDRKEVLEINWN